MNMYTVAGKLEGLNANVVNVLQPCFAPCKVIRDPCNFGLWNPESKIWSPATYGIRSPWMWDPESTDIESGIHFIKSGIQDSLGLPYMGRLTCPNCVPLVNMGSAVLSNISSHCTSVKSFCFVDQALSIFSTVLWVDHIGGKVVA